jgi:hypothetical protein
VIARPAGVDWACPVPGIGRNLVTRCVAVVSSARLAQCRYAAQEARSSPRPYTTVSGPDTSNPSGSKVTVHVSAHVMSPRGTRSPFEPISAKPSRSSSPAPDVDPADGDVVTEAESGRGGVVTGGQQHQLDAAGQQDRQAGDHGDGDQLASAHEGRTLCGLACLGSATSGALEQRSVAHRIAVTALGALALLAPLSCAADDDGETGAVAPGATPAADGGSGTTSAESSAAPGETTAPDTAVTVPDILQFQASLVGGGDFDATALAGQPVAFWFWSPF